MRRINFGAPGAPFTKARALAWEEVRTAGAIAGVWTLVCIGYAFQYQLTMGEAGWRRGDELLTGVMYFAPALLALLLVLNPNNTGHLTGGFSQRVLRLPVSVGMAAPIALFGRALLVFASTALILGANRLLFDGAPELSLALLYVLFYLAAQTVDWLRAAISGLTSLLAVAALIALTAAWGHWEHVEPWLHTPRAPGWGPGLLAVGMAAALAHGVSVLAVGAVRTGRRVGIPEIWEWPERFSFRRAPNLAPFSSPLAAQTWFELRRVGWVMPLTAIGLWTLVLVPALLLEGEEVLRGWSFVAVAYLMILTLLASFLHALRSAVLGFRFKPGQIGFEYMRPMSSAHYASAKIRANALIFAPLLLMGFVLLFLGMTGLGYLEMLQHTVSLGAVSLREAFWALMSGGVLFAVVGWVLMAVGTRLLRWFILLSVAGGIIAMGAELLAPESVHQALHFTVRLGGELGLIAMVLTAYALAWRKHLLSTRSLACWMAVWVGAAWLIRGPLTPPGEEMSGLLPGPVVLNAALACLIPASAFVLPYPAMLFDINRRRHGAAVAQDPCQHESLRKAESSPRWRFGAWAMTGAAVVLVVWLGGPREPAYKAYLRAQGAPATAEDLETYYRPIPDEENAALKYLALAEETRERAGGIEEELLPMAQGLERDEDEGGLQRNPQVFDYVYVVGKNLPLGEPIDEDVWAITEAYWEGVTSDIARELKRIAQDGPTAARYPMDVSEIYRSLEHLSGVRQLARQLWLDTLYWSVKGDAGRATDACLAMLPLAESLNKEPEVISQLSRLALFGTAHAALETMLNRAPLTEADLQRLQEGFEDVYAAHAEDWMLRHGFMGERAWTLTQLGGLHHYDDEDAPRSLDSDWVVNSLVMPVAANQVPVLYFYSRVLDSSTGVPRTAGELRRMEAPFRDDMYTSFVAMLGEMHVSSIVRSLESEWRTRTSFRLAQTAIAVERFRLEHERWPENLSELVPEYLDEVPRDLFCFDGEPLRYVVRPDGSRRIYSVGENHRDHGGVTRQEDSRAWDLVLTLGAGPR